jgi:hypothetical protein
MQATQQPCTVDPPVQPRAPLARQDEVSSWEGRLATLLEGLGLLQAVQRRWLYLGPIFARGALPAVAGRFRHVDAEFCAIMAQLQVGVRVIARLIVCAQRWPPPVSMGRLLRPLPCHRQPHAHTAAAHTGVRQGGVVCQPDAHRGAPEQHVRSARVLSARAERVP